MLTDYRENPEAAALQSDVCIVGAGAAGIPLARQLAKDGHSVCLLESGGLEYEQPTQDLYLGKNVGMPYYDLEESRLRFFGGTTRIWGGRCALLDPIDFEQRDWVPYSGWPINRRDLDPYYRRAHEQFELGEFNYERDIWAQLGVDEQPFNPERIAASLWRFDEVKERYGPLGSKDVIDSERIHVLLHANVVRLQATINGREIEHLVVRSLAGEAREIRARHYVLAAGAIENARLLLASNDVEKAGVGNGRDQVGRYFMEHPVGRLAHVAVEKPFELWAAMQKRFMRSGPPLAPVLRLAEATQRREAALNSAVTFKLQRDPALGMSLVGKVYPTLKHSLAPSRTGLALNHAYRSLRGWIHREVRESIERLRSRLGLRRLYMMVRSEQSPNPDSRVLLSEQRDALGEPLADLNWQLSAPEKHTASVLVKTLDEELKRLQMGRLEASDWLREPGLQWPQDPTVGNHPIGGYHHMGTTRMSTDPGNGVVDANCRVHGYGNLFVAGSSVFSTSGWANPTLTLVALSYRLAAHLDEQLRD
ncbi:MAG: GMC family oxidoreductase [Pseudomonadota bacterium]